MSEQIINYYVHEISEAKLIQLHISRIKWIWLFAVISVMYIIFWIDLDFALLLFAIFLATFFWVNKKYKDVLLREYGIKSSGFFWNKAEYSVMKQKLLADYLDTEFKINTTKQLDYLIDLIDKKAEQAKVPFFANIGIISAVALPVWIEFVSWLFNNMVVTAEHAGKVLAFLIVGIPCIWICLIFCRVVHNDIVNMRYQSLMSLSTDLREIQALLASK